MRPNVSLLPTLFDRLRDDAPSMTTETSAAYAVSSAQLRDIVQRDLAFLLNTVNAEDLIDRGRHAAAAASSINFGVPPLTGAHVADRRWDDMERKIRRAIADYEPRLLPDSVSVAPLRSARANRADRTDRADTAHKNLHDGHVLQFEIRALIDARPYPLSLTVQSAVDLETSRVRVMRAGSAPASAD